jgi:uncharacterized protein YecT (DUF1311 family)
MIRKQSTAEMIATESARLKKADDAMNATYKKLLATQDKIGQKKLKNAQLAWLKFRDAEAEFDADLMRGGTGANLIHLGSRSKNTELRLKELDATLKDRLAL